MRKLAFMLLIILSNSLLATTVYETIDANGNPSFSNVPPPATSGQQPKQVITIQDQTPQQQAAGMAQLQAINQQAQQTTAQVQQLQYAQSALNIRASEDQARQQAAKVALDAMQANSGNMIYNGYDNGIWVGGYYPYSYQGWNYWCRNGRNCQNTNYRWNQNGYQNRYQYRNNNYRNVNSPAHFQGSGGGRSMPARP